MMRTLNFFSRLVLLVALSFIQAYGQGPNDSDANSGDDKATESGSVEKHEDSEAKEESDPKKSAHAGKKAPTKTPTEKPAPVNAESSTEVEFVYSEERLTNGYGDWRSAGLDVVHKFDRRKVLYASYRELERFRKRDRKAMIGFYQPLNEKWTLLLEAHASPTHKVVPKWSTLAQIERSFKKGLILKSGFRRTSYNTTSANIVNAEVEKYFGNNRAAYSFHINNLKGAGTSPSHRIQYTRYYGSRINLIGASYSFGKELESLGDLGTLQSRIKNLSVSGRHWVKRKWAINYGVTVHQQGDLYIRSGLRFGVRYKF